MLTTNPLNRRTLRTPSPIPLESLPHGTKAEAEEYEYQFDSSLDEHEKTGVPLDDDLVEPDRHDTGRTKSQIRPDLTAVGSTSSSAPRHSPSTGASLATYLLSAPTPTPIPWKLLLPLLLFPIADAMTYSVLFPLITDMLTSFRHPRIPADKIGLYAGLGEGTMMLVEALCAPFWARAADRYGRRKCLVYGFGVTVLGSAGVGWARGVGWIVFCRAILGLNPAGVVTRLSAVELSTPSNRARIFSILSPSFSIGMLLGTFLGGELAHPYGRLPRWLGGEAQIWRDWPFALPCVAIAAVDATVVIIGWMFLAETQKVRSGNAATADGAALASPPHPAYRQDEEGQLTPRSPTADDEEEEESKSAHSSGAPALTGKGAFAATLAIPSFLLLTSVFLLFQISTFSWDGMYAVYTYTPASNGGLGLPVDTIGILYAVSYLASFALNPLLLPWMSEKFGTKYTLMGALGCWVLLGLLLPLSQWGALHARGFMWVVVGVQLIFRALGTFGWALCDILTLSCFDDYPELMATSSAISLIGGAGGRAFGPALSGWLFSISSQNPSGSWGRQVSWLYITLVSLPAFLLSFRIAKDTSSGKGSAEYEAVPLYDADTDAGAVDGGSTSRDRHQAIDGSRRRAIED